jgi:hypothetical protein
VTNGRKPHYRQRFTAFSYSRIFLSHSFIREPMCSPILLELCSPARGKYHYEISFRADSSRVISRISRIPFGNGRAISVIYQDRKRNDASIERGFPADSQYSFSSCRLSLSFSLYFRSLSLLFPSCDNTARSHVSSREPIEFNSICTAGGGSMITSCCRARFGSHDTVNEIFTKD